MNSFIFSLEVKSVSEFMITYLNQAALLYQPKPQAPFGQLGKIHMKTKGKNERPNYPQPNSIQFL